MQNSENVIYFNFSYFALRLLGKGLYSNHWTAIAELVANGLDAQANSVKIYINMKDKKHSTIEIFDNGSGMNYNDLAEKYVLIGKDKREDNEVSDEVKKQLMGRKGIGKLAALYLSNKYYLITKTKENCEFAWCLDASIVKDSDIPHLDKCNLEDVGIECKADWNKLKTGTMIRLTNVDLTNFGVKTLEGFKARLADFYLTDSLNGNIEVCVLVRESQEVIFEEVEKSIAFKNFYAFYNNSSIQFENRLSKEVKITTPIDFIISKLRPVVLVNPESFQVAGKRRFEKADGNLTEKELDYCMTGWIGIHTSIKKEDAILNDPDYLRNKAYRPNQLRLYVRKKLAVENFLDYVKNTQAFSNYIEGEISFDILDDNELGDIATSNRQGFVEDDERVQLLIEILKPIINYLIRSRIKIGNLVSSEVETFYEEEKRKEEVARKAEEEKRRQAEREREQVEYEKRRAEEERDKTERERQKEKERAESLNFNLGSEKKRNVFLLESLDENQIDFAERLHMLKINSATMDKTIKKNLMKLQRGKFSEQDAWELLKKMSYLNSRIKAVLEYGARAKFNTKEEFADGDVFEFIKEYCNNVLKSDDLSVIVEIKNEASYRTRFVPQDIVVILDNILSNSIKHRAETLFINMYYDNNTVCIDFVDNGKGINPLITNLDELFDFGKGYTQTGTGVGLYHVREIVERKMNGKVSIVSEPNNGFIVQVRI